MKTQQEPSAAATAQHTPMSAQPQRVLVGSLTAFYRPESGSVLLDGAGKPVGSFDFNYTSDQLFRCEGGEILRSDSWVGLLWQVIPRFS